MDVKQYKISDLNLAEYNPRGITDDNFLNLIESLKNFGPVQPAVFNTRTKTLVGGHMRVRAAKELKWQTFPVVEVELNESDEKALNLTLNNKRNQGFFQDSVLEVIAEIKAAKGDDWSQKLGLIDLEKDFDISWDSDIEAIDKIEAIDSQAPHVIKVTCPQDIKDEVLIYLKAKLLETSFEGVHVE